MGFCGKQLGLVPLFATKCHVLGQSVSIVFLNNVMDFVLELRVEGAEMIYPREVL